MSEVEDVLRRFTALSMRSRSTWSSSIADAAVRLQLSLQSYASHRGHVTLWRMLRDDFTMFELALTAHHPSA